MKEGTNFYRTYTLKCGKMGKKGFVIGNTKSVEQNVLHISFSVEKSDAESSNTAKIQVWNLSPDHLKLLEEKKCTVWLKAGYNMNDALILAGNVSTVLSERDNSDVCTEINVVDGMVATKSGFINISKNTKTSCKTLYQLVAKDMGLPIKFAKDLKFKSMKKFAGVGKGTTYLKKIAKYCGHSWSIQNEVIQIVKKGGHMENSAFVLEPDTGLVSVPKKVTLSDSKDSNTTMSGYEIEYFLNGAIGINDVIYLKSDKVKGYFKVFKISFNGDNYSGDWICKAQVVKTKIQGTKKKTTSKKTTKK